MKVGRLRHIHSDPLFAYTDLRPIELSNRESVEKLLTGEVDLAFVSLVDAAENCDKLVIADGVAIYSVGEVLSARLFKGRGRGFAAIRETRLAKLVVEKLMGIQLIYVDYCSESLSRFEGVLVIGDDALRLVAAGVPHIVDVGELWYSRTGTPLVFAVLAARRGLEKSLIKGVVEKLQSSVAMFYDYGRHIIEQAARKLGVPTSLVEHYYMRIRWLTPQNFNEILDRQLSTLGLPRCLELV